ncbi:MAG: hypothetical protein F6K36_20380 [Symploca sp. SIO3C6]|nr:hypothetical protein [Symploca sp. SIO3C6]NET08499.1 hypothetical protein [Symploca sp. SIO2B6]
MSIKPTPEPSAENHNSEPGKDLASETIAAIEQQQLKLKLEVEKLYRDVERQRGWFQTLVSGLVMAIMIAIGISSWFAYRLVVQEQITQREATETAAIQAEILEQVERLEQKLQKLNQQTPEELAEIKDATESTQRELQQLLNRLNQIEAKQRDFGKSPSSAANTQETKENSD